MTLARKQVLALSGGVGGAKLSLGLERVLPTGDLHVLVNTGDDFTHLGLHISPDIDTVLYTLSGRANQAQGWGLEGETWNTMEAMALLEGDTWFRLGDRDLATHLWRRRQLDSGLDLAAVTRDLACRLGVPSHIYPMCRESVRTTVHTDEGDLPFQHYFVRRQCEPRVRGFSFEGLETAQPEPEALALLASPDLSHIVVCPSNPFVSIDPILQVGNLWQTLRDHTAPVILVSPIVNGMAIKGPAAKMMAELQVPATAVGVARYFAERYPALVDYFLIDHSDATLTAEINGLGLKALSAATVMTTLEDKMRLAQTCLALEM
jgi:LPPG:FO 2-phospho-L-lactate transferase